MQLDYRHLQGPQEFWSLCRKTVHSVVNHKARREHGRLAICPAGLQACGAQESWRADQHPRPCQLNLDFLNAPFVSSGSVDPYPRELANARSDLPY